MSETTDNISVTVQEADPTFTGGYLTLHQPQTNWGLTVNPNFYERITFADPSELKSEITVRYDAEVKTQRRLIVEVSEGVPTLDVVVQVKNPGTPISLYIEPFEKD